MYWRKVTLEIPIGPDAGLIEFHIYCDIVAISCQNFLEKCLGMTAILFVPFRQTYSSGHGWFPKRPISSINSLTHRHEFASEISFIPFETLWCRAPRFSIPIPIFKWNAVSISRRFTQWGHQNVPRSVRNPTVSYKYQLDFGWSKMPLPPHYFLGFPHRFFKSWTGVMNSVLTEFSDYSGCTDVFCENANHNWHVWVHH